MINGMLGIRMQIRQPGAGNLCNLVQVQQHHTRSLPELRIAQFFEHPLRNVDPPAGV